MPYCTLTDLTKRFPEEDIIQLTDDAGEQVVDEDAVSAAIADADAEIDSYLRGRYRVPIASAPADIVAIAVDITRYNLHSRPGRKIEEVVKHRYDAAIRKLERLQSGVATLDVAKAESSTATAVIASNRRTKLFPDWRLPR